MLDSLLNNIWALSLLLGILLLGISEAGFRAGSRLHATKDEGRRTQLSGVRGTVFGLLGILLGFTFAMGLSRYDTRREMVVREANAIGTTWLRAGLLPAAYREQARALLREYVDLRLRLATEVSDSGRAEAMLAEGGSLGNRLWRQAEQAAAESPTPVTVAYITALNEMIDTGALREAAVRNRIPTAMWTLLVSLAALGCFISSYNSGAHGTRSWFTNPLLPAIFVIVILLVFDLTHSRQGFIRITQQPMFDLQRAMQTPP